MAELLARAETMLAAAGVDTPKGDAQWIAAHVLGVNRTSLLAHPERVVELETAEHLESLVARRAEREPLGYVLGTVNFRGLVMEVGPGVFCPRPETEVTAARAIARARERGPRPCVVDVCAGSGPIALSVAAEVPNARVFATEISPAARGWALRNLARTGLRVTLLPGDLFDPLHPALGGAVDVIVSNPPYIPQGAIESLPDEVRRYEPREALTGGADGLDVVMRLIGDAPRWLTHGGWLVMEVGEEQAERIAKVLAAAGYDSVEIGPDLAGRERVVEGRWVGNP
ncbi:MAG TPA: peptide chain release factor N(5)-glutamine methyltransferase [Actinomycetota bacterium]|nr:peptide chain release factor N(5)-glutamine methyltransferase [Actinomycetota bacterium]